MKSLGRDFGMVGRVWIPAEWLCNLLEDSRDQQDSCEVSRKSLDTIRIAVQFLGRVLGPAG